MQDVETESLWSQVSGEAIQGPLKGSQLTLHPSSHTTFGEFKKLHPKGQLLKKPPPEHKGSRYADYFSAADKLGIFGRVDDFQRLPGKALVYGLRIGNRQVAITLERLEKDGTVVVRGGDLPVVVTFDAEGATVKAYYVPIPEVDKERDLKAKDGRLMLDGTALSWSLATGKPSSDSRGLEELEPLPILSSYWFAWISFFPETELIQ